MKIDVIKMLLLTTFLLLISPCIVNAQKEGRYLRVGDKIPDISFPIEHYTTKIARISDFKGKLVILDLWGIYCSACISSMPQMENLQRMFNDKIQIISVTKNTIAEVNKLARHSEIVNKTNLPSVTGEGKLASFFDYQTLPTHVWIDQRGYVKYITYAATASVENIDSFLKGNEIDVTEKIDIKYNREEPLLVSLYPYYKDSFSIYSYLAPYISKFDGGGLEEQQKDKEGNVTRIRTDGTDRRGLYKIAYGYYGLPFADNRILLKSKDANDFIGGEHDFKNWYKYDLMVNKKTNSKSVYRYMQQQLDLLFQVTSSLQKLKVASLVLRLTNPGSDGLSDTGKINNIDYNPISHEAKFTHIPWRIVMDDLYAYSKLTLIDETGIDLKRHVDFRMIKDFDNLTKINESLKPYGLEFIKEDREMECIIIDDSQ